MIIKKVSLQGFKIYQEEKTIEFSQVTNIYGDNAQGKTTIADAICWGLLGCTSDGVEKAAEKLLNDNSKGMTVSITFTEDDKEHIVTRIKKGAKTILALDGNEVGQLEIMQFIKSKELFLTMFNTCYFTTLAPKDQKAILQKYLGDVDKDQVFQALGTESKLLIDDGFTEPMLYISQKNNKLKDIELRVSHLQGYLEATRTATVKPNIPHIGNDTKERLEVLQGHLKRLEVMPNFVHDITQGLGEKAQVEKTLKAMQKELEQLNAGHIKAWEEQEVINKHKQSLMQVEQKKSYIIGSLEAISTITCPHCHTEFEQEPGYRTSLEADLKKYNNQVEKGQKLIVQLEQELAAKKEAHDKAYNSQVSTKRFQIVQLEQQLEDMDIMQKITENTEWANKLEVEKNEVRQGIREIEAAITEADQAEKAQAVAEQQATENEEKRAAAEAEIVALHEAAATAKEAIERAKRYAAKRLTLQGEYIGAYLKDVTVQMQKLVKSTGEIKDDFSLQYQGRDFFGLSCSERTKVGLEIGNLLRQVTGANYPIFVDNANDITCIPKQEGQMIAAYATLGAAITTEHIA